MSPRLRRHLVLCALPVLGYFIWGATTVPEAGAPAPGPPDEEKREALRDDGLYWTCR